MNSFKQLKELEKSRQKQKEAHERLLKTMQSTRSKPVKQKHQAIKKKKKPEQNKDIKSSPPLPIIPKFGQAHIPIYRDDEVVASKPSQALQKLVDLYLHAAQHGTRHIALVWPVSPRTLVLIHALATLERWADGDKQGVRGVIYPVKSNIFHPLNHLHFGREEILSHAQRLYEPLDTPNNFVTRPLSEKDPYLYSLASLKPEESESFNPTISELLPHFYSGSDFEKWTSCERQLLVHTKAKLIRRKHAKELKRANCAVIGDPDIAPDAIFALDGRLDKETLRGSLSKLKSTKPPEVILINATRAIRRESKGWKAAISRFCLLVEEVFPISTPGIIIVTDEPHAAFSIKNRLWDLNKKRDKAVSWHTPHEYSIIGMPCAVKYQQDGLVPAGIVESLVPVPRELDVKVVDAEAAKIVNKLQRIAKQTSGGIEVAIPVTDAAGYLTRMAALPCGVSHLVEWLSNAEIDQRTRTRYDWLSYVGALRQFDRDGGASNNRKLLLECIEAGSELFELYYNATPFALRLAEIVSRVAGSKKLHVMAVFTNALYRRLAERFLITYSDYPNGREYKDFSERVQLITTSQLEERITGLSNIVLVFVGLDDEGLRIVLTDDHIPAHTSLLLTQRSAQYLRSTLKPITEYFSEFKPFKPRVESILRQLKDLPEDASVLSTSDFVLPTFKIELNSFRSNEHDDNAHDGWRIILEFGQEQYHRPTHKVYVYDPSSAESTDRGFRACEVRSLKIGDKLFVMSADLREQVELVLEEAGVPIHHDKTFEEALRSYHKQVRTKFAEQFPIGTLLDKVRNLRSTILQENPELEQNLPGESAIRRWVDLDASENTSFDKLKPQAPMKEAHFKAFSEVLKMTQLEAAYQWQRVIIAIRNTRRQDGRHVSDIYAYMLLQPESAMVHANISRETLKLLFDQARESVVTVEAVIPNEGETL